MFPTIWRVYEAISDRFSDVGVYWVPRDTFPDGGHWAERWYALSKLWRQKWCYFGLHGWCLIGPRGDGDYFYVGLPWDYRRDYWPRERRDWLRFCACCPKRAGTTKYEQINYSRLTACEYCRATDSWVARGGGEHFDGCPYRRRSVES